MTFQMRLCVALACLLPLIGCQTAPNTIPPRTDNAAVRLATWNIHYIWLNRDSGSWSRGHWESRKRSVDAAFKALDADLVAFQEMESFAGGNDDSVNLARAWLLEQNPDYAAAAIGDWREFPSTQPMLYRPDRLILLDQGWFFFSDTPDVIYSRTFNGSYPAFASWAQFRAVQTGKAFRVVNVHVDFSSRENREKSIALTLHKTQAWIDANETVFLVGDFNSRAGSALIDTLENEDFRFADVDGSTYHFNRGINLFGAIDHVAVHGDADIVRGPWVLRRKWHGIWPSDHYPVIADYRLH